MPSIANYLMGQDQEDIRFQSIEQSFKGFQARKGYNEITFTTDQNVNGAALLGRGGHLFDRQPILLWLDRDKTKEVDALNHPAGMTNDHYMDLRLVEQALQQARKSGAISTLQTGPQCELAAAIYTLEKILGKSCG